MLWLLFHSYTNAQNPEELWSTSFPEPDTHFIHIEKMISDAAGNTYLTGFIKEDNNDNYITLKYNNTGLKLWSATYDSPYDSTDWASDIAIDDSGNVYVTGYSFGEMSRADYLTIKYNNSGVVQWIKRFNQHGPYAYRYPVKLALDNQRNVFVTGVDYGTAAQVWDFVTVKYNNNGTFQWSAHFDPGGSGNVDSPKAITCDNKGNVIVTGQSLYDFTTVKYSPSGTERWVKEEYILSGYPVGLGTDNFGNIYVSGNDNDEDEGGIRTIKYDSSGTKLWDKTYFASGLLADIKVLNNGYLFLAGDSSGTPDKPPYCSVLKLSTATGALIWAAKHDQRSWARNLSVDAFGNSYISAYIADTSYFHYSTTIIKYNAAGKQQWIFNRDNTKFDAIIPNSLSTDGTGNIYTAISNTYAENSNISQFRPENFTLIKINSSGQMQWYSDPDLDNFNNLSGFTHDGRGNIYATGFFNNEANGSDIITAKFDSSGNLDWHEIYNGPADTTDIPHDICMDSKGNVYVAGESEEGAATKTDFIVIKYDSSGTKKWTARYNGPDFSSDEAQKINVDQDDNVYVAGNSRNTRGNYDIATVKFNGSGQFQWAKIYNGPSDGNDVVCGLGLDPSGNVYIGGTSDNTVALYDYLVLKYTPAGDLVWEKSYDGPAHDGDRANAMAVDDSGNVYITGGSFGNGMNADVATVKYNTDGILQWEKRWDDPAGSFEEARDIAIDHDRNIYVTGFVEYADSGKKAITLRYNQDGMHQWTAYYNAENSSSDVGMFIAPGKYGNSYVVGESDNKLLLVKNTLTGDIESALTYEPYELSNYVPSGISADQNGNIFIAGTIVANNWSLWNIRKYKLSEIIPTTVDDYATLTSVSFLLQNYPNPFNTFTTISYALPAANHVVLKVYDPVGKLFRILLNDNQNPGEYKIVVNASDIPAGIYFYQLWVGSDLKETNKMMVYH